MRALSWGKKVLPGVLVGILGAGLLFKDLILAGGKNILWGDNLDPRLMVWILSWGYHILFEAGQPQAFWNANSFYPNPLSLTYSDSLLSAQLFFAPLRLLGLPPLAALYVTLAAVCVLGAGLTYAALTRIGGFSVLERLFITFCAHFGLSMTAYFVHYQLFGFELAPPYFLFLFLYLRDLRARDLIIVLSIFGLAVGFAVYLAPMLLVLSGLLAAPFILEHLRRSGIRLTLMKVGAAGFGTFVLFTLILYFIQFKPYFQVYRSFPPQRFSETARYSADYDSFLNSRSKFSLWYGPQEYSAYGEWEYAYFPGLILLSTSALFMASLLAAGIAKISGPEINRAAQHRRQQLPAALLLFMAVLLVACLVLSWGPHDQSDHSIKLPFYYFTKLVPGLRSVRAPGRFGMLIGLPLAIFSVALLRRWVVSVVRSRSILLALFALVAVESLQAFPTYAFSNDPTGIYRKIAAQLAPGTPLVELPVFGEDHIDTVRIALEQLNGSTIHWGRLVVGYGARTSREYTELLNIDRQIQAGELSPSAALLFGDSLGIHHYVIHLDRYDERARAEWLALARSNGSILFEGDNTLLVNTTSLSP
jgi:hypothetical protein